MQSEVTFDLLEQHRTPQKAVHGHIALLPADLQGHCPLVRFTVLSMDKFVSTFGDADDPKAREASQEEGGCLHFSSMIYVFAMINVL